MLINTDLWICVYISYVDTFALQIVLHVPIGHEGQDNIWREVRGVKTHSKETQDVIMAEVFHNETFGKETLHFILRYKVCVCVCMHVHAYDHKLWDTWDIVHNIQSTSESVKEG